MVANGVCQPLQKPLNLVEPRRAQFSVTHRVLNILVPKVGLQRPCVVAPVRQCEPPRMAQHVRMHAELELGLLA